MKKVPEFEIWLEETYKELHRHPELGMREHGTTAFVKSVISELGLDLVDLPGLDVGAVCVIKGTQTGPTLALRADMDALPIEEQASVDWRSQNEGVMHACGHDLNTTVMLGVLRQVVSRNLAAKMKGTLKFIFQPGEETLSGARAMINAGVLKNPDVDMILMSHGDPDLQAGEIALFKDYSHANSDHFAIELKGKGGHGARPFQTQDLILAGAYLVNILQSIVSRDLDARDAAVLSVCSFNAGSTSNVLPSYAKLTGTVRTLTKEVQSTIMKRMKEACDAMGVLFHMEANLDYHVGVPSCAVADAAEELIRGAALKVISPEKIKLSKTRMGGEDFAFYSQLIPAGVMRLGVTTPGEKRHGSTHSPLFQPDLIALPLGVRIMTQVVEDYLL